MIHKTSLYAWLQLISISFVSVISFAQSQPLVTLNAPESRWIESSAFTPDGSKLVTSIGNQAAVWDVKTGNLLLIYKGHEHIQGQINDVAVSEDGRWAITAGSGFFISIWDIQSGEIYRTFQLPVEEGYPIAWQVISTVALSPDNKILLAGGNREAGYRRWDVEAGTGEKINFNGNVFGHIQYFPDGQKILFRGESTVVSAHDMSILHQFPGEGEGILTKDGKVINYDSNGVGGEPEYNLNTLQIWDPDTGKLLRDDIKIKTKARAFRVIPDGLHAFAWNFTDDAKRVDLLSLDTGEALRSFVDANIEGIQNVEVSPDLSKVAISYGKTLSIYDISDLTSGIKQAEVHEN